MYLLIFGVVFWLAYKLLSKAVQPPLPPPPPVIRLYFDTSPVTEEEQEEWDRRLHEAHWGNSNGDKEVSIEDWRETLVELPLAVELPLDLQIVYKSEMPLRKITVHKVQRCEHADYLHAWCALRADWRNFRLEHCGPVVTVDGEYFETGEEWLETIKI
ncbi:hypothetical protein DXH95_03110 [Sphingorhabdus pulchriflava]|uniref:Uncharacterized protein n=2 Tax=Sphingorhabdus pulchriflava TaxID=2292257 RepID=A0A371BFS9_9SPHN|nr:hypothetical protein DXH95_03110 [Sphingorhabdus pulchriflava]